MKKGNQLGSRLSFFLYLGVCLSAVSISCSSKAVDPRSVIPSDALVYLETRDLGKSVGTVTESGAFAKISKTKPDLSSIAGVQMSVAVTGFRSDETQVADEQVIGKIIPQFVAVVETNAWGWQASSFVENKLGEFINEVYGGGVELVVSPKGDGKYYVWSAQDGRKAFAFQHGSLIFFGNDETAIEKCQAVRRGEAESIAKNPQITDADRLAFGYISPDGIAQIANVQGVSVAMDAGEDAQVKSFIARVLPEILRNSIREVTWTATKAESGRIVDNYTVGLQTEMATIFATGSATKDDTQLELAKWVPAQFATVTIYQLADAQATWQGVLQFARSKTDPVSGGVIEDVAGSFFESYAIENSGLFLASVSSPIITVKLDPDSHEAAVIARASNVADIKRSIAKEISFAKAPEMLVGAELWTAEGGEWSAAFAEEVLIIGDSQIVRKCLVEKLSGEQARQFEQFTKFGNMAPLSTIFRDSEMPAQLGKVLGQPGPEPYFQDSFSLTRFEPNELHRVTDSDFGLIGALIAQFVTADVPETPAQ